jgi:hypothetical protein
MFINLVPFLVSVLRHINLITIERAPHCTATKLGSLIQCILCVYAQTRFMVQTNLMDNEFVKLRDHVTMLALNIPVAGDHIGEVKQCIWVIIERARGIICTLSYPHPLNKCLYISFFL